MSWLIRIGWTVGNHGVGLRWLLVLLLLAGPLLDARRLRRGDGDGPVLAVPFLPTPTPGATRSSCCRPMCPSPARAAGPRSPVVTPGPRASPAIRSCAAAGPLCASRSYLEHTSPLGGVADAGEAVLTFLPGNFVGTPDSDAAVHTGGEKASAEVLAWLASAPGLPDDGSVLVVHWKDQVYSLLPGATVERLLADYQS